MAAFSESAPVFKTRCAQVGLDDDAVASLEKVGVNSLAKVAFMTSYTPGSGEDKDLIAAFESALGSPPSVGQKSSFRRLFHEAYAVTTSEMKLLVERTDESVPRKLSVPERSERFELVSKRLVGLSIRNRLEPADSLVDAFVSQYEQDKLQFVPWEKLVSKEQEASTGAKREPFFSLDSTGKLRSETKVEVRADTSTELLLQLALQRRGVALGPPSKPVFLEICSGSAMLSYVAKEAGYHAVPIDWHHNRQRSCVHALQLDLRLPSSWSFLERTCLACAVAWVHMAPPCGTASRARECGPGPKPLRSMQHVRGLPGLSSVDQARVESANAIYDHMAAFCKFLALRLPQVPFSVENPLHSYLWQLPAWSDLVAKHSVVTFDSCRHGSQRKKATALLTNSEQGQSFATAEETGYPKLLCERSLPDGLLRVLFDTLTKSPVDTMKHRLAKLQHWRSLAQQLEPAETKLRSSMDPCVRRVLGQKRVELMRRIVSEIEWPDMSLFDVLAAGFKLTGYLERTGVFASDLKPAAMDHDEFWASAALRRGALLEKVRCQKDQDLASETLGVMLDTSDAGMERILVANKPERASMLADSLGRILESGQVDTRLLPSLLGKLRFADAQLLGRTGRLALSDLRFFGDRTGVFDLTESQINALTILRARLIASRPRAIATCPASHPVLVFTDGACDPCGDSFETGVGGVLFVPSTGEVRTFGCKVPDKLVRSWAEGRKHIIGQVELFAVVLARTCWSRYINGRRCIFFVDHAGVLNACINSNSIDSSWRSLLLHLEAADEEEELRSVDTQNDTMLTDQWLNLTKTVRAGQLTATTNMTNSQGNYVEFRLTIGLAIAWQSILPGPTAVWPVRFDVSAGTAEFMDARVGWPVTDLEPLPEGCR
ncbi:hypothetical protein AK812_SmicGene9645 [Symbiodinium microadriaticum]|uniref:Uncharacterized protein n=1 Tax=Symbiodinium microadriaticum TaxID=2951 RepID=A0A1Q9EHS7_SYMMI|nr:hypothetical protein AK812_SmicGene9645 [Symbiodinium microadriaticum]